MPDETKQWIDAIAKLTRLTQEGSLVWSATRDAPGARGATFYAEYKGKPMRLYRSIRPMFGGFGGDREVMILEFVDASGNSLWAFPETPAIDDLYEAVKYQVAGVQSFLDDILK
jgi:hypothetical protein